MASTPSDSYAPNGAHRGNALVDGIVQIGGATIDLLVSLGDVSQFVFNTLSWMLTRLPRRETILPNFYQIGVLSLPVVALTGTFIGMVLVRAKLCSISSDTTWKRS